MKALSMTQKYRSVLQYDLKHLRWILIFSFGLMVILLTALSVSAQELVWEQTNGPYGGSILALLSMPDSTLYAGTNGSGVFRSDDKGNSWINIGLTNTKVTSFAVMGTTHFAGTENKGVFRSDNKGNIWTEIEGFQINKLRRDISYLGR